MNTVSLVTGGNRGIGLQVCRQLAERGHSVLLTARSADAAAAAVSAARTEPLQLDVTDPASIAAAARQVAERYGRLDVVVNNAAITYAPVNLAPDVGRLPPRATPPNPGVHPSALGETMIAGSFGDYLAKTARDHETAPPRRP